MDTNCAVCNEPINIKNNIYKGFDCTFCSTYCRTKMWTKIYQEDINFTNPELWPNINSKNKKYKWEVYCNSKKDKEDKQNKEDKEYIKISETKKQNKSDELGYNIYKDNSFVKYYDYNCSGYSIYDYIPVRYITNYLFSSIESSMNLFR